MHNVLAEDKHTMFLEDKQTSLMVLEDKHTMFLRSYGWPSTSLGWRDVPVIAFVWKALVLIVGTKKFKPQNLWQYFNLMIVLVTFTIVIYYKMKKNKEARNN